MNELVKVNYNSDRPTVLGRELHEFLEVDTPYTQWFERMCEYGFNENADFKGFSQNCDKPRGGRPKTDHQLTIEMAKELCMLQRTEKGKQARQYFIQLESAWNTPEMVMARAIKEADKQLGKLTTENAQQKQLIGELTPKADYTDRILQNKGLVTITQIAKDYGMSGRKLNQILSDMNIQYKQSGQWLLYRKYHGKGYTHSKTIEITRADGTPDIVMETKWTQKGRLFLYELLRENEIYPVIEKVA